MGTEQQFSIDELCALTDLSKRTVRYYIQLGLVERPLGETRAARYTGTHLEQLLRIRKWSAAGVSLERIGELLAGGDAPLPPTRRGPGTVEVWSHLLIADGVELHVEPGRAGLNPEQVRQLHVGILRIMEDINQEKS